MSKDLAESQQKLQSVLVTLDERNEAEVARRRVRREVEIVFHAGGVDRDKDAAVFDKTPTQPPQRDFSARVEPDLFRQPKEGKDEK